MSDSEGPSSRSESSLAGFKIRMNLTDSKGKSAIYVHATDNKKAISYKLMLQVAPAALRVDAWMLCTVRGEPIGAALVAPLGY